MRDGDGKGRRRVGADAGGSAPDGGGNGRWVARSWTLRKGRQEAAGIVMTLRELVPVVSTRGDWTLHVEVRYDRVCEAALTMTKRELALLASLGRDDSPLSDKLLGLSLIAKNLESK